MGGIVPGHFPSSARGLDRNLNHGPADGESYEWVAQTLILSLDPPVQWVCVTAFPPRKVARVEYPIDQ